MKYKFRIEITLNDELIISEGKHDVSDVYRTIIDYAKEQHLTRLKAKDEKVLLFGKTGEHKDDFSECWIFQTALLETKWFKKYARSVKWYNDFDSPECPEDVLDEYYNSEIKGL